MDSSRRDAGDPSIHQKALLAVVAGVLIAFVMLAIILPRMDRASKQTMFLVSKGKISVDAWLADLGSNRLDAAYAATTPAYRSTVDRAAFDRLNAEHPALRSTPKFETCTTFGARTGWSFGLGGFQADEAPARFESSHLFRPADGSNPIRVKVVAFKADDRDALLIDQIRIEPVEPAKP